MSLRNRIATAALTGLSLVMTLAFAPMAFGQEAKTPAPMASERESWLLDQRPSAQMQESSRAISLLKRLSRFCF